MILGVFGLRDKLHGAEGRVASKTGKREYYDNYSYIADCLDDYDVSKIISGGGFGVEQLAMRYATTHGIDHMVIPPSIALHGPAKAWEIRNREILSKVDFAVLFWDGKDKFYHALFLAAAELKKNLHLRHVE